MQRFEAEPLHTIAAWLRAARQHTPPGEEIRISVPDPDLGGSRYSGERLGQRIHRSHKTWVDLAERLDLRYLTPIREDKEHLILRFTSLEAQSSFHEETVPDITEKYGVQSPFTRIEKLEEPHFLLDYQDALERVKLQPGMRVLDLGINSGDEFEAIRQLDAELASQIQFTGIDHSASAIARARERFPEENYRFHCEDITQLQRLQLPPQDLIISIGTLQSRGIDDKDLIMWLRKTLLKPGGAFILGFPCVRYSDGELKFGARVKNYREPELSLLVKDLFFYRRYLNKHGYRVTLTGKYYIFLTAWR